MSNNYEKHDDIYSSLKSNGFNGWGGKKFDTRHIGWKENVTRILNYLGKKRGKLAELGSGTGDSLFYFENEGFEITGFEVSKTAVKWAYEKAEEMKSKAEFFNLNLCDPITSFDKKFDVIVDGNCAHCIAKEDRKSFFENIFNLLKDDGIFYISSITSETKSGFRLDKNISPVERFFCSKENLIKELNKYGFVLKDNWFAERMHNDHFAAVLTKNT